MRSLLQDYSVVCSACGRSIPSTATWSEYCSKVCFYNALKVPVIEVWLRDQAWCHICGATVDLSDASRDHLQPRSYGGPTTFENVALAHKRCNSRRGNRPVAEAKAEYVSKPGQRESAA